MTQQNEQLRMQVAALLQETQYKVCMTANLRACRCLSLCSFQDAGSSIAWHGHGTVSTSLRDRPSCRTA